MRLIISTIGLCLIAIVVIFVTFKPEHCEHEDTIQIYNFQYEKSAAGHSKWEYCNVCKKYTTKRAFGFRGTPTDQSYLETIVEQSDAQEIIPGEYYTVTVTVTSTTLYDDGTNWKVRVGCKLENEDFELYFSADFRKEFWDQVKLLEDDDVITFRGRFYDTGCGFKDCELIK